MSDIEPETLLEWLQMGIGEERDIQLLALEQLCMMLLISDNVDKCFESVPPRTFLPALCQIFLDHTAPDSILEVTARALTYYLDISVDCSRRIVTVDGSLKAIIHRMEVANMSEKSSRDFAEQCVKMLELICSRESEKVFEAGGLLAVLNIMCVHGAVLHKDTLRSCMTVVSRLVGRLEPSDASLPTCVASLSKLLQHDDSQMSDGALRCFINLVDRFIRKGQDPAPVTEQGLTHELIARLMKLNTITLTPQSSLSGGTPERPSTSSTSNVINLLSSLCRGSASFTHSLLRMADLLNALECAMKSDERTTLDLMRFIDLLLLLIVEGRECLPKGHVLSYRRMESNPGDMSHRHVIELVRSGNVEEFIEIMESGFDVNFMDDMGQTLLNWAAAFGPTETVEYLLEQGAEVNTGVKSSSLHYAACFGRPSIVKLLLRYGGNPELKDEDGKTPLEKAKEKDDEWHKQVVEILENPEQYIQAGSDSDSDDSFEASDNEQSMPQDMVPSIISDPPGGTPTIPITSSTKQTKQSEVEPDKKEEQGDPEMLAPYLRRLMPLLASVYLSTMAPMIKKESLRLLRKMCVCSPAVVLEEVCSEPSEQQRANFAVQLTEVIMSSLTNEESVEGQLSTLQLLYEVLKKCPGPYVDSLVRLGVPPKIVEVAHLTKEPKEEPETEESQEQADVDPGSVELDDAATIQVHKPYYWKDWILVRSRDSLYLWNDFSALKLSKSSNGWFIFLMDDKLATMYSSGNPEPSTDSLETSGAFVKKLQSVCSLIPSSSHFQPVLSSPGTAKLMVGTWILQCVKEGQLHILNTDGTRQTTIISEGMQGFTFESNRGSKVEMKAETASIQFEFSPRNPWCSGKRKYQTKQELLEEKLRILGRELVDKHFKVTEVTQRAVVLKLQILLKKLQNVTDAHNRAKTTLEISGACDELKTVFTSLGEMLSDENLLSPYELHSSGLVQVLLHCLTGKEDVVGDKFRERVNIFISSFSCPAKEDNKSKLSPALLLARRLVSIIESQEKFPLLTHDSPGATINLQVRTYVHVCVLLVRC
jgi:E3 ubiquitin-protein ligase HECTD1